MRVRVDSALVDASPHRPGRRGGGGEGDDDGALRSWDAYWDISGRAAGGGGGSAAGTRRGGSGQILDPRRALGASLSADLIVGFHPVCEWPVAKYVRTLLPVSVPSDDAPFCRPRAFTTVQGSGDRGHNRPGPAAEGAVRSRGEWR